MAAQLPLQFEYKPDYTFASFFAGNNLEVVEHLQQCISGKGESQILVWGTKGQGKSHLLQACCRYAQQMQLTSFYLSLHRANLPDPSILDDLETMTVVCLDNIDSLIGHKDWENALFVFYNQQRDQGHRLILSASNQPIKLAFHLPDLHTRLSWGLVLKLQKLDDEEKIYALTYKARQLGLEISPQVGRFLIQHYSRDLPSLWELLDKIDQATLAAKRKLSIPFLKSMLEK